MVAVQSKVAGFATDLAGRIFAWRRGWFGNRVLCSRKGWRGWWLISGRKGRIVSGREWRVVGWGVAVLTKWFGKESRFSKIRIVVVGRFGAVRMECKGTCFKVKGFLLILKEYFMAKQLGLKIMKCGFSESSSTQDLAWLRYSVHVLVLCYKLCNWRLRWEMRDLDWATNCVAREVMQASMCSNRTSRAQVKVLKSK